MRRMMVEIPVPQEWKELWNRWDLRGFIILSLSLQTFLIFVAPLRKRIKSNWVMVPLWSAYLLADWAATFAVGLISNSQANPSGDCHRKVRIAVENEDLLAFWGSFLLVHLGGPDTITAFALEDNELWLRHLFGLVFQCIAAVYVFVQSLPQNQLWVPTMLMFITGIIKYAERTRSLYLASADIFKQSVQNPADPGTNYAKLMDEFQSRKDANLPTRFLLVQEPAAIGSMAKSANKAKKGRLTELEVVQYGYMFFNKFKGLIVDIIFSRKGRNESRDFFLNRNAEDAFKVVEVELNFIYDVLYTKVPVLFADTKLGQVGSRICRFFSLTTVCSATVLFIFKNKSNFTTADVSITYGLLFGALVLDLAALIMLPFSDWTIISICESPDIELQKSWKKTFYTALLKLRREGIRRKDTSKYDLPRFEKQSHKGSMKWLRRRWSESVSTYNLISYCLYTHWTKDFCDKLPFGSDFYDSFVHVKHEEFTPKLRNFIFAEIKSKLELGDDLELGGDLETAKEISSARGDWVLRVEEGWSSLLKYVLEVDYDQSLILWHITTELCYNNELYDEYKLKRCIRNTDHRKFSKVLSDYMLYLLIMQPTLMSAVAGIGQIRFRDTCAEARRFFEERDVKKQSPLPDFTKGASDKNIDLIQVRACDEILKVFTAEEPVTIKGDRSKSLLFDSCILAKELMNIERKKNLDKWLIISKVWVELLCYGASHSRANVQAAQVSNGGELITIVWLLMTHFGLGEQFQINEEQIRAKVIVGK